MTKRSCIAFLLASGCGLATAITASDATIGVAERQAAYYGFDLTAIRRHATTDNQSARGFFALGAAGIFDKQSSIEYADGLHDLLDQLGEKQFVSTLLTTAPRVQQVILGELADGAGYDTGESSRNNFAHFYPEIERLIRASRHTATETHAPIQATVGSKADGLAKQRALAMVAGLAEVQAFDRFLLRRSRGEVKVTILCESETPDEESGWEIYVGEDHNDHRVRWARFLVDPDAQTIAVKADTDADEWISLKDWRKTLASDSDASPILQATTN